MLRHKCARIFYVLGRIYLFFILPVFFYQNCAKVNFTQEQVELASKGSVTTSCVDCPSTDFIKISINGSDQVRLKASQVYPVLIELGADSQMDQSKSSLETVMGECRAGHSWALDKRKILWTKDGRDGGDTFLPGMNDFKYSSDISADMDGCTWKACVQTVLGAKSCLFMSTDNPSPVMVPGLPPSAPMPVTTTTMAPTTTTTMRPTTATMRPTTTTTTTMRTTAAYPTTTTMPPPTTTITTTTTVTTTTAPSTSTTSTTVAPPQGCNASNKPQDVRSQMNCSLVYGSNYAGVFEIIYTYRCEGDSWVADVSNDAPSVCFPKQCAGPTPETTTQIMSCADRDSGLMGTYTVTTSYSCDSNLDWAPSSSDNFAESCKPAVKDPTDFYCGSWDGKAVAANVLWKVEGSIRYYIGTSGASADTISCVGLWNETMGVWESSRLCKYADRRECQNSRLSPNSSSVSYPACPAGMAPDGDGCAWRDCASPLENGYCVDSRSSTSGSGGSVTNSRSLAN